MNLTSNIQFIIMSMSNLSNLISTENNEKVLIFDIDDTLYKRSSSFQDEEMGMWVEIYNELQPKETDIPVFSKDIIKLQHENEKLYSFVKKVTYELENSKDENFYPKYLCEYTHLRDALNSIPYKKWCFTNGPKIRAERILKALGITNCFEGVFYPSHTDSVGKPKDNSYEFVEKYLKIVDTSKIYFYDDLLINIQAAEKRGWNVIHVKEKDDIVEIIKKFSKD